MISDVLFVILTTFKRTGNAFSNVSPQKTLSIVYTVLGVSLLKIKELREQYLSFTSEKRSKARW